MSNDFAILIPVGKGTGEVFRLRLLLKSIMKYEPTVRWIVIIDDDELHNRQLTQLVSNASSCDVVVLKNPRNGRGNGFVGGLTVGVMHGLAWIYENTHASFVLKMDTDALVIAPFALDIAEAFTDGGEIGQVGVIGRTCNRSDAKYGFESHITSPLIEMLHQWMSREHGEATGTSDFSLDSLHNDWVKPFGQVQHHVVRARSHGYSSLSYCQGGAYAVSREMLRRLSLNQCFVDYDRWVDIPVLEDVVVAMYTHSVGMKLGDRSMENQPFGVHWHGLPFDPDTLIAKRFSIIHSLKNNPAYKENMVYSYFLQA